MYRESDLSHLGLNYVHGTFLLSHTSKRSSNANMNARRRKECHGTRITAKFSFRRSASGWTAREKRLLSDGTGCAAGACIFSVPKSV
ncbi:protein of unknown function [Paenibacillus alvei]|uniref:Uncharacterized protein n=1 Tax=Paenibacillus alvei TaxID=44250 RepID=A0A383R6E2_PAEAL|nr:protein of unknown function [Paenibacillus alvei]